jgi:hypothetical protein
VKGNRIAFERLKRKEKDVLFQLWFYQKRKRKKFAKKLDNIRKILTFAVPTNRESANGC